MKALAANPIDWALLNLLSASRLFAWPACSVRRLRQDKWAPQSGRNDRDQDAAPITKTPIPPQLWPSY
jgi:hypothetical protein